MIYKTLSVNQPYATLICAGVKDVENRKWTTKHRGKLLIHAIGEEHSFFTDDCLPSYALDQYVEHIYNNIYEPPADADIYVQKVFHVMDIMFRHYGFDQEFAKKLFVLDGNQHDDQKDIVKKMKEAVEKHGFFFKSRSIIGECDLADIVQDSDSPFAIDGRNHWIIRNPVLYDKPITDVIGRQKLWNFALD